MASSRDGVTDNQGPQGGGAGWGGHRSLSAGSGQAHREQRGRLPTEAEVVLQQYQQQQFLQHQQQQHQQEVPTVRGLSTGSGHARAHRDRRVWPQQEPATLIQQQQQETPPQPTILIRGLSAGSSHARAQREQRGGRSQPDATAVPQQGTLAQAAIRSVSAGSQGQANREHRIQSEHDTEVQEHGTHTQPLASRSPQPQRPYGSQVCVLHMCVCKC